MTDTKILAERLAAAYRQAMADHSYAWGNPTEESFILPALEAVLEAERTNTGYVYIIRDREGDVESVHHSEETAEAETKRLNEEYVAEALSRGYRVYGPYWWAESEVQA